MKTMTHADDLFAAQFRGKQGPCMQCYISATIAPIVLLWGTVVSIRWLYRRLRRG
jgi:hypothetical protein